MRTTFAVRALSACPPDHPLHWFLIIRFDAG